MLLCYLTTIRRIIQILRDNPTTQDNMSQNRVADAQGQQDSDMVNRFGDQANARKPNDTQMRQTIMQTMSKRCFGDVANKSNTRSRVTTNQTQEVESTIMGDALFASLGRK